MQDSIHGGASGSDPRIRINKNRSILLIFIYWLVHARTLTSHVRSPRSLGTFPLPPLFRCRLFSSPPLFRRCFKTATDSSASHISAAFISTSSHIKSHTSFHRPRLISDTASFPAHSFFGHLQTMPPPLPFCSLVFAAASSFLPPPHICRRLVPAVAKMMSSLPKRCCRLLFSRRVFSAAASLPPQSFRRPKFRFCCGQKMPPLRFRLFLPPQFCRLVSAVSFLPPPPRFGRLLVPPRLVAAAAKFPLLLTPKRCRRFVFAAALFLPPPRFRRRCLFGSDAASFPPTSFSPILTSTCSCTAGGGATAGVGSSCRGLIALVPSSEKGLSSSSCGSWSFAPALLQTLQQQQYFESRVEYRLVQPMDRGLVHLLHLHFGCLARRVY